MVTYKAKVRNHRLIELPIDADDLRLKPGQDITVQLDRADSVDNNENTLSLLDEWDRQDAYLTADDRNQERDLWQKFEIGINHERKVQNMRPL